jgi:nitrite reductase/ring-hydroxylating ferredoxin subunit
VSTREGNWIRVGTFDQVSKDRTMAAQLDGHSIAVCTGASIYALDNRCPIWVFR